MKLLLIRHGETDWNVAKKIQGSADISLNEKGIQQAHELGAKFLAKNITVEKIYSSPLKRAVMTAEILSQTIKKDMLVAEGLKEINLGEWEGLPWPIVAEKYPQEYQVWYENRRYTKTPQGESYEDMLQRVLHSLKEIIAENNQDVAIVSHSAVIMCLQCLVTNTPFEKMMRFKTENTVITELDSQQLLAVMGD